MHQHGCFMHSCSSPSISVKDTFQDSRNLVGRLGCLGRSGTLASLHTALKILINECLALHYRYSCFINLLGFHRPWTASRSNIGAVVEEFEMLIRLQLLIQYSYCTRQSFSSALLFTVFSGRSLVFHPTMDRWRNGDCVVDRN